MNKDEKEIVNTALLLAKTKLPTSKIIDEAIDIITDDGETLNIIELDTVEEANKVDLSVYRWSERMSAKTGRYVFVLRQIKKTK